MKNNRQKVIALLIDGKDVMHTVKPYLECISLPGNVTAEALCSLYCYLENVPNKKFEETSVVIVDYDLNENTRKQDEYLFE